MKQEKRTVVYDHDLGIEAYWFQGLSQKFPNHFHEYYVIGCVQSGRRYLICNNAQYTIDAGDLVLFNPRDAHACEEIEEAALDWCCINVTGKAMRAAVLEITGREELPVLGPTATPQSPLAVSLQTLNSLIINHCSPIEKEEAYLLFMGQLLAGHAALPVQQRRHGKTHAVCKHLDQHFARGLTLDELAEQAGLNKYTMLRAFTREHGVTPHQYLQTVRTAHAKTLLEEGVSPIDAALRSGFADQSHFTRVFKRLIGVSPGQYQNIFRDGEDEKND